MWRVGMYMLRPHTAGIAEQVVLEWEGVYESFGDALQRLVDQKHTLWLRL